MDIDNSNDLDNTKVATVRPLYKQKFQPIEKAPAKTMW